MSIFHAINMQLQKRVIHTFVFAGWCASVLVVYCF